MQELVSKLSCIVAFACVSYIFLYAISEVRDALAAFEPAYSVFLLCSLLRVNAYFHTVVEQRVRFGVVHYVELNCLILPRIFHLKEEPLSMTCSVNVVLHK